MSAEELEYVPETQREDSLEKLFQELDQIIEKMEEKEVSLEDAFTLYESGMKKIRQCNEKLDLVEKKMLVIANEKTAIPFE